MLEKIRINKRVVLIGLVFLVLYLTLGYIYTVRSVNALKINRYKEVSSAMQSELLTLIKEKQEAVLLIGISLSQHQSLYELLIHKKNNLNLKSYAEELRKKSSLKNIWFQVLDKEGISIYRSWTDKKGDTLAKVRADVANMIANPQIISSISTGVYDMTFKTMVPLYDGGEFIGAVETIAKFNSIVIKMQESKYKTLVLVDPAYKKQLTRAFTKTFIEDYYVASLNTDSKLMEVVKSGQIEEYLEIEDYIVDEKNSLLITLMKQPDMNGKDMGYFIIAQDFSDIKMSDIEQSRDRIIMGLIIGFVIITGFLFYLYTVNYKRFLNEQRRYLQEQIESKTHALRIQSEELRHIAHHDSLTNLPNRLLFLDRLKQVIKHAKREEEKISVLFLDLDRFKEINDTYGHDMGDKLLQVITKNLKECVREEDTIARLGGDEFTIILQNVSEKSILRVTDKIIERMQNSIFIDGVELFVTFSIGISCYPQDGESADLLIRNADTAMYRAKEMGKNNYQFYNASMTEHALQRIELQNDIKRALEYGEFEPYYQPKIDTKTSTIVGLEALVRWNHPVKGVVYPGEFIEFSEEVGLIEGIDAQVMKQALREVKKWRDEGIETGRLALNISAREFECQDCTQQFDDAIVDANFDTQYLEFEITESQIMTNPKKAIEILQYIKERGIKISVDDFGTGYSSLSYLKELPVDTLKIDRSFIIDMTENEDDEAIVKIIIALAENLHLDVIAEGVESEEQVALLSKYGCHIVQGYHYSKPLPADDCRAFLLSFG